MIGTGKDTKVFCTTVRKEAKATQRKVLESKRDNENSCFLFQKESALKFKDTADGRKSCRGWHLKN